MTILLGLLAVTGACTPAATPAADNAAVVRSFFAAVNANDDAAIGALLKPGALYFAEDETTGMKLDELLTMMTSQKKGALLKLINLAPNAKGVEIVTQADGGPNRVGLVKLDGGCIAEMES